MTDQETTDLTMAMAASGETLDLSSIAPIVVDKHSTGGVGDKTTLVVGPIASACGLPVGKMSGRGLGFSGGTLDKMEAIPGYRVDLSQAEFLTQLKTLGLVLTGQSADLAPADGKLYALRDVTGTVPSIPLIASSVMSKKIAAGAHAIVLDVKLGNGAFMKTLDDATHLAETMVSIGRLSGRKVVAVLSDMNQPLGCAVGNAIELKEAIETLNGGGPADFKEHCLLIASYMLLIGKKTDSLESARTMAEDVLNTKKALDKFRKLVIAQGGDVSYVDNPEKLPLSDCRMEVKAEQSGYLGRVHALTIGETAADLGAGRSKKGDAIDQGVGILVHVKVGEFIKPGDPLFTIYSKNVADAQKAKVRLLEALTFKSTKVQPLPLIYGVVGEEFIF
jgi:pyrimidine-nucleoside phosphorylase